MKPEDYRQAQADIASKSEQTALVVAATSGLAGFSLVRALTDYLMTVKNAATMLADAYTAAALGLSPLGLLVPVGETERLQAVLAGVMEDNRADPLPRIARIAASEPATAARETTSLALVTHNVPDAAMQWVLDEDPCPLCLDLASRNYRPGHVPRSHPGCECTTAPVLITKTKRLKKVGAA